MAFAFFRLYWIIVLKIKINSNNIITNNYLYTLATHSSFYF